MSEISSHDEASQATQDSVREPGQERLLLAPVSPGELIDRLTILQIKSKRLSDPEKLKFIHAELKVLQDVRRQSMPHTQQLNQLSVALQTVNETLWQIEDDIRAADVAGNFGASFVALARSVYQTNDRRADLKRQINLLLQSAIRDEKHYNCQASNALDRMGT